MRLFDWIDDPDPKRGLHFASKHDWDLKTWEILAGGSLRASGSLRSLGLRPNDVVNIVLPNSPQFVEAMFGVWRAGGTCSPLAPPGAFASVSLYDDHLAKVVEVARSKIVVVEPEERGRVDAVLRSRGLPATVVTADELTTAAPDEQVPQVADYALLQFTSGSTGTPRGVRVTFDQLHANLGFTRDWLIWRPEDLGSTWLPVHHDMGLVGSLLTSLLVGSDLLVMTPEQFVRDPLRWIASFGRLGATLTATPTFGLAYVLRRVGPQRLEGMDFSAWRGAVIGAERVDAATLRSFEALLRPHGFRATTLLTGYGLAEATLAVAGKPLMAEPWAARIDHSTVAVGDPVAVVDRVSIVAIEPGSRSSDLVVACGVPLGDVALKIVDDAGEVLPEDHVGEIVVNSSAVASGYIGDHGGNTRFDADGLHTGDIGFLHDGSLCILGRVGDAIKVRGRMVLAEDVELAVSRVRGVPNRRSVVLLGSDGGRDLAVVVVEGRESPWEHDVEHAVRDVVGGALDVDIVLARPGAILRTTSGKPRRALMWQRYREQSLR